MRAFTIIELLIIIAVLGILAAATTPFLSRFVLQTNLDTTTDVLVSSLRKAQSYSSDGKNASTWGVCMNGSSIRLFTGSCNTPTFNEDYSVPGTVSISGLPSLTFSTSRGEPSATFSATISSSIGSHTVSVSSAGILTLN